MLGIHALVQTRLNWVFRYWEYFHQEYYATRLATSMSMFSILSYSCKRSVTYQFAGITGNSLWIWCSFLLVSLKTFLVILLCFFNHMPSWYVEWRTSATSSGCRRLPPSSSVAVRDSVWAHRVPTADLWYHVRLAKEVSARSAPCQSSHVRPRHINLQVLRCFPVPLAAEQATERRVCVPRSQDVLSRVI